MLCGRCGMWNTMGPATKCNFQGFCFEVSESFGYHFLNPDTRYLPFLGGEDFLSPRIGCLVSFQQFQRVRRVIELIRSDVAASFHGRNHSIQVENRISLPCFTTDVFLEMVETQQYAKNGHFSTSTPKRPGQLRKQKKSQGQSRTCSNTSPGDTFRMGGSTTN